MFDTEQLKETAVKLGVGALIGIGGSALLKLGSKVCSDAILDLMNQGAEKAAEVVEQTVGA